MTLPAYAGTNIWTGPFGGTGHCSNPGSASWAEAVACTLSLADSTNPPYAPHTYDSALTTDLTGTYQWTVYYRRSTGTLLSAGWQFTNSCGSMSPARQWDATYRGCAEICVGDETLNTTTGLCEGPPNCDEHEGALVTRFFSGTTASSSVCANPPGSESLDCAALVADPVGTFACAGGECFARLMFTGDQCGAEPDITSEVLTDEPGNTNCVAGDGVTFCAAKSSVNCGTVNGESICLESVPPGRCAFLGNGGLVCGSAADGPTESDGVTPAEPDGEFTAGGDDAAEDEFRYFGPGTVASSGTPISGTSNVGTSDPGDEPGEGPCDEAGSCPGTLPELGATSTIGEATEAFLFSVETSPVVAAAMSLGTSWPVGECPAPSATIDALGDVELTLDAHCALWDEWGDVLGVLLLAIFVFIGARIVLSA